MTYDVTECGIGKRCTQLALVNKALMQGKCPSCPSHYFGFFFPIHGKKTVIFLAGSLGSYSDSWDDEDQMEPFRFLPHGLKTEGMVFS